MINKSQKKRYLVLEFLYQLGKQSKHAISVAPPSFLNFIDWFFPLNFFKFAARMSCEFCCIDIEFKTNSESKCVSFPYPSVPILLINQICIYLIFLGRRCGPLFLFTLLNFNLKSACFWLPTLGACSDKYIFSNSRNDDGLTVCKWIFWFSFRRRVHERLT